VRILAEASKQLALDHQQSIQAIAIFRSAIVDSDSLADLKQRFLQLQAPPLPADAEKISLGALKNSLLQQLSAKEATLNENFRQPLFGRFAPTLIGVVRDIFGSLILAAAFASAGSVKGRPESLLQLLGYQLQRANMIRFRLIDDWLEWKDGRHERRENSKRLTMLRRARQEFEKSEGGSLKDDVGNNYFKLPGRRKKHGQGHSDLDYFDRIQQDDVNVDP
jgi:hypothetical protein